MRKINFDGTLVRKIRKHNTTYNQVWRSCQKCGKERWVLLRNGQPFNLRCHSCALKYYRRDYSHSGNPNWKGGICVDMKMYRKEYNRQNKDKKRIQWQTRKARELNLPSTFTLLEWKEIKRKYNHKCACCKQGEPKIKLTIDHIIPLCKSGHHTKENIQPLCMTCNLYKARAILKFDYHKPRQPLLVSVE